MRRPAWPIIGREQARELLFSKRRIEEPQACTIYFFDESLLCLYARVCVCVCVPPYGAPEESEQVEDSEPPIAESRELSQGMASGQAGRQLVFIYLAI